MDKQAQVILAKGLAVFLILSGMGGCDYMISKGKSLQIKENPKIEEIKDLA